MPDENKNTSRLIKNLYLRNFLGFGAAGVNIELRSLNVIIGPNGSGKSNFIEAIDLIHSTPSTSEHSSLLAAIRDGGGVRDWLWKGSEELPRATIEAVFERPKGGQPLRYVLAFSEVGQRFEIQDERIESENPFGEHANPYIYYALQNGHGIFNLSDPDPAKRRRLQREEIDSTASILSQRKDPDSYPELTELGARFAKIRLYRNWRFGRDTPPRLPQKTDLPNNYLSSDANNLALVLNRLGGRPAVKRQILKALRDLYEGIDDFSFHIAGGTVQIFIHEGSRAIPATRFSDGTLRYLCLLTILCDPEPPPLICIEEPELGLHPDMLPRLAKLLIEASERAQLIITTHSDMLVDALSDMPEAVLVAERSEQGATLERLNAEKLGPWLDDYRLGQLWIDGKIGGTRW